VGDDDDDEEEEEEEEEERLFAVSLQVFLSLSPSSSDREKVPPRTLFWSEVASLSRARPLSGRDACLALLDHSFP